MPACRDSEVVGPYRWDVGLQIDCFLEHAFRIRRSVLVEQKGSVTPKRNSIRFIALVRCDTPSEQLIGACRFAGFPGQKRIRDDLVRMLLFWSKNCLREREDFHLASLRS